MRKEQTVVGWQEGYETADEVLNATIVAMMKPCGPRSTCPARYRMTVKMPDGTKRSKQSAFLCSGAESELIEMMARGSDTLWFDPVFCLGNTPRRCKLSIVLETAATPTDNEVRSSANGAYVSRDDDTQSG